MAWDTTKNPGDLIQSGDYNQVVTQIKLKSPIDSPTFTGVPAAPTAALGTNTTQLATTAFVLANAGDTFEKTFTISPSGNADYTTIQAALTANPTQYCLFLVYPGVYTGDTIYYTANNQSVIGMDNSTTQIIGQVDTNVVNFAAYTGCVLNRLTVKITGATSAIATIKGTTGNIIINDCTIEMTNASVNSVAQPSCIEITSTGTATVLFGFMNYTNTVALASGVKSAIVLGTGSTAQLQRGVVTITGSGTSSGTTLAYGTGTGVVTATRTTVTITDPTTTEVVGFFVVAGNVEITNCHIHITGGTANRASGIWNNGTGTTRSFGNHIHCVAAGGGTANSFIISGGATLVSEFDDIIAAEGVANSGTYTQVNSPISGNLNASGSVRIGSPLAPTARLHLPAGSATASTAPIKLTAGTSLTTPEAGVIEFDGTNLFITV